MSQTATMNDNSSPHPVDEKIPVGRRFTLGIQHVLVMYAGAVAVPLIVGPQSRAPLQRRHTSPGRAVFQA